MEPYKYLPHTADAKFQAFGKTFEEALKNAGVALCNLVTDVKKIKKIVKKTVEVESNSRENLTVDFLQEILYSIEVDGFLTADAALKVEGCKLSGALFGDLAKDYETHGHVKAVTYHDLQIKETSGGFMKWADSEKISKKAKERGKNQLGTVGAGNHFLEIQVVDKIFDPSIAEVFGIFHEDQICVMVHCGRGARRIQDIDEVVRVSQETGIGRIVARLIPLGVVKG